MSQPIPRVNVLGTGTSVINLRLAGDAITAAIAARQKGYICITGVHGVTEAQDDPAFKDILHQSFLTTPDGHADGLVRLEGRAQGNGPRLWCGLDADSAIKKSAAWTVVRSASDIRSTMAWKTSPAT